MSAARETYTYLRCTVCTEVFADIDEFRGHEDADGVPCTGGTADA